MNIRQLLDAASGQLQDISDSPKLDAELLLAHALNTSRTYFYTWPHQAVSDENLMQFEHLLEQRLAGKPIAYITGEREFWSLKLRVNESTLIPRPETELLVETALQLLPGTELNIADLGTGSGAIALALAHERPQWHITATDQSAPALAVARRNAQRLKLANIDFVQGDWFAPLRHKHFHAILSNPPYIAAQDTHLNQGDVRFEPATALVSGSDGLDAIRKLIAGAHDYLLPDGWLMIEHGYDQAEAIARIFSAHACTNLQQLRDLSGQPRISYARYPRATSGS